MEIVTSWERKGIEIGRQEGHREGRQEGRQELHQEATEALRAILLDVLTTRFGQPSQSAIERVRDINVIEDLKSLIHSALTANSLHELDL